MNQFSYENLLPHEKQAYDMSKAQLEGLTMRRDERGTLVEMSITDDEGGVLEVLWSPATTTS